MFGNLSRALVLFETPEVTVNAALADPNGLYHSERGCWLGPAAARVRLFPRIYARHVGCCGNRLLFGRQLWDVGTDRDRLCDCLCCCAVQRSCLLATVGSRVLQQPNDVSFPWGVLCDICLCSG